MPTPVLFTVFSFLLRVVEGTGTAMYTTVSYTLLTQFYPEKKGTVVVSDFVVNSRQHRESRFPLPRGFWYGTPNATKISWLCRLDCSSFSRPCRECLDRSAITGTFTRVFKNVPRIDSGNDLENVPWFCSLVPRLFPPPVFWSLAVCKSGGGGPGR